MNILPRKLNVRNSYIVFNLVRYSSASIATNNGWKKILNNAEKVVGYPTSFLNLRWLLNDEVSNIAFHITKLIGTNHPLIQIARNLLQHSDCPKWGLIVLLMSKAAGIKNKVAEIERDVTSGILHNQRALAEITEMIRTGNSLHNGLMKLKESDDDYKDLTFGNKIALLGGDYLFSKSFQELAQLRNSDLQELISTSIRDLAEAHFIQPRDEEDNPLPCYPCYAKENKLSNIDSGPYNQEEYSGNPREEWILRTLLNGVNLLAQSCKGALILGEHPDFLQKKAYIFGRSLGLAWQASEEIKPFVRNSSIPFKLVSAPVLFQLHNEPSMYKLFDSTKLNYEEIRERTIEGVGIEKTMNLQLEFVDEALDALEYFPPSDAKNSLVKIVSALDC
ncbi:hypothetical protein WA026_003545 [Henosepilachna vigintioctopunctata]|uniref:Decaprenyl-diphosphate synthase subunit 2 n=1 Tax=Henosepilachna vigintioctopunctata TaxID=420089 RepID=A0AAW1THN4_9CUCU